MSIQHVSVLQCAMSHLTFTGMCLQCDYGVLLIVSSEEVPAKSKTRTDTSDEYLKWTFSKEKGKKGLYFEYKPIPSESTLVSLLVAGN